MDSPDVTILKSFHHVPDATGSRGFSFLFRAGHFRAGPGYFNERTSVPGHEIFLCLGGRGYVRQGGRQETVEAGSLVWIDVNHPHRHWADAENPWEVYWLRAGGIQMNTAREILGAHNCFCVSPEEAPQPTFDRIFQLFENRRRPFDALANAEVARLIALFVGAVRLDAKNDAGSTEIAEVLEKMRISSQRPWRVEEIARRCGKSPAQTHRLFQRATGSSPIALLRRMRLEHAMERLVSTEDSVAEIAYQVGYNDPLFFSRDFKKMVGRSPTEYRRHER